MLWSVDPESRGACGDRDAYVFGERDRSLRWHPYHGPHILAFMTAAATFEPTLESLRTHRLPAWYDDAKLGIFIHWSLSSVPGFATRDREIGQLMRERYDDFLPLSPYTEWYENAIKFNDSPSARHHRETYGDRPYAAFQADWEAGLEHWRPEDWAARFARAGARYVVLVTKHHDGYCLWPSKHAHPIRPGWHCPRDVVGDFAAAVRAEGMRFGVYYSGGIDWSFNPTPVRNMIEFMASVPRGPYIAYAEAQVRELIERVAPDILWNDIAWPTRPAPLYRLFADYTARSSARCVFRRLQLSPTRCSVGA
jgi:alpha-L-fucosidase